MSSFLPLTPMLPVSFFSRVYICFFILPSRSFYPSSSFYLFRHTAMTFFLHSSPFFRSTFYIIVLYLHLYQHFTVHSPPLQFHLIFILTVASFSVLRVFLIFFTLTMSFFRRFFNFHPCFSLSLSSLLVSISLSTPLLSFLFRLLFLNSRSSWCTCPEHDLSARPKEQRNFSVSLGKSPARERLTRSSRFRGF